MTDTITAVVPYESDPSALLEAVFAGIQHERMADLPLLNHALCVRAVGFERFQGNWIGVLITPWFLNLIQLPGPGGKWPEHTVGKRLELALPSGRYRFACGHEDAIGPYLFCSLMSPVKAIASQTAAVGLARDVMDLLLEVPAPEESGTAPAPRSVSRRGFLRVDVAPPPGRPPAG